MKRALGSFADCRMGTLYGLAGVLCGAAVHFALGLFWNGSSLAYGLTMKRLAISALILLPASSAALAGADVICSYAPSQSANVASISALAGGAAATAAAVAKAAGLTAVLHSSGAYILTGSGGYVAGTLGGAAAGPAIFTVGLIVGGAAVTVELLCAPRNHPGQMAKITAAAEEFGRRINKLLLRTKSSMAEASVEAQTSLAEAATKASPAIEQASVSVKRVAGNVYDYAYQKSQNAKQMLAK
jgi:hypothetical protein